MDHRRSPKPGRAARVLTNVGVAVAALWLLTYLVPATRAMMVDWVLAFVLGLMATGLLWLAFQRSFKPRGFWGLLAAAWTLGMLGNISWGVYELVTGRELPYVSLVDILYLSRYVLAFAAFWRYVISPRRRRWASVAGAMLLAVAILAGDLYLNWRGPGQKQPGYLLAGAVYPILDAGLVYISFRSWASAPEGRLRNALGLLMLGMITYGMANWLNFHAHLTSSQMALTLTAFFWPLSDILTGIAVIHLLEKAPRGGQNDARPELRSI